MKLTKVASAISLAATRLGLGASVSADGSKAAASVETVKVSEATPLGIALEAQVKPLGLATSISPIKLAYELGMFILSVHKRETVGVDDGAGVMFELFVRFFKTKTDHVHLAESIAAQFYKTLRDEAELRDDQMLAFFKALADHANVHDEQTFNVQKPLHDLLTSVEDHAFILMKKTKDDGFLVTDSVDEIAVSKALVEAAQLASHQYFEFGKPTESTFAALDAQTQAFVKAAVDQLVLDDAATRSTEKALFDSGSFADAHSAEYWKPLADQYIVGDAYALDLSKPAFDAVEIVEAALWDLNKALVDLLGFADNQAFEFFKALSHESVVEDQTSVLVEKPLNDSGQTSDAQFMDLAKELVDGINVTDDMDGEATALDDQEMQFVKQVADIAGVTDFIYIIIEVIREFEEPISVEDAAALSFGKPVTDGAGAFSEPPVFASHKSIVDFGATIDHLAKDSSKALEMAGSVSDSQVIAVDALKSDSASISDTGSLVNQSYCSEDYFAEDYVGVSQTF